jgi:hypothetical protein
LDGLWDGPEDGLTEGGIIDIKSRRYCQKFYEKNERRESVYENGDENG